MWTGPQAPNPDTYWVPLYRAMLHGQFVPDEAELLVIGPELQPDLVFAAYRNGLFPMGTQPDGKPPIGWWSPNPRGVLLPGELRVSRSLRRSAGRLHATVDQDFDAVVRGCADPDRSGRWITARVHEVYAELHRRGQAHSVEVWRDDELVGGLYGIGIGGLFAGESMFHRVTDASKVALMHLVERFFAGGDERRLIDVQWLTPHLGSLGCAAIARTEYLRRLGTALSLPEADWGQRRARGDTPTPPR
ncbi:leucyl/phenylalanyl-tRNA--protein transferase [Kineosphaera limosa NBRC 100340]|uniref:Leucyl/phenylalanyl-tRNA--protein transferase n=1 Tax=Kineosphaera limosa NBRC 100340 TaxID=1184609 RepID=K6WXV1_9MICO|nr:leucyl/phenylalanyl-tRNA--protein transferase [Kineosphaera limosa NBRC 100340]